MKRFLSLFIVLLMVISLVSVGVITVFADDSDLAIRAVTADDVTVTSSLGGVQSKCTLLFDGVKPEPGYWSWSNEVWDDKENGDYVEIAFEDQVLVSKLAIFAIGNYSYASVKGYNAMGEEVLDKAFNPNSEALSETKIIDPESDEPVDLKSIKIIANNVGKVLRVGEVEINAHFHSYSDTATDIVPPTCSEPGTGKFTCPVCEGVKTDKVADPLGNHIFSNEGTPGAEATADTQGEIKYPCTNPGCDEFLIEKTPITTHNCTRVVVAPDCTNGGYVQYTCDKTCGDAECDYTYKTAERDALGHIKNDSTTVVAEPTIISNKIIKYTCQRTDCGVDFEAEVPGTMLKNPDDAQFDITMDNITSIDEVLGEAESSANRNKDQLFDGITVMGDYWTPKNFWSASTGSSLTINFDKEYVILDATIYAASNDDNTLKIQCFDAEGNEVGKTYQSVLAMGITEAPVSLKGNFALAKVKKIVITVVFDKWGKGNDGAMKLTELEIVAHKCEYKEEDRAFTEVFPTECKTVFDGTCHLCGIYAEDVVEYSHTFEKEEGTTNDKLYVDTPATCITPGVGHNHCTVCDADVSLVIESTGIHDFENGKETVVTKNNCGTAGEAYKTCAIEGCGAKSENYVLEPTGKHPRYNWVELEGQEADYTHEGVMGSFCAVCNTRDEEAGTKASNKLTLDCIKNNINWSIRYTDYVSPRANFKLNKSVIEDIADEYSVKVYGVVKKGEVVKEVLIYDEDGAASGVKSDGTFALVVKNAGYTEEYEFSVRVEITDLEDKTSATSIVLPKPLTTDTSASTTSAKDVATYFLASSSRAGSLDAEVKKFYELVKAAE